MAFDFSSHLTKVVRELGIWAERQAFVALAKTPFVSAETSPIEVILGCALFAVLFADDISPRMIPYHFHTMSNLTLDEIKVHRHEGLCLAHQVVIGPYRADFVVTLANNDESIFIAVECDGHDFHERTKEQAARDKARDRYMQALGMVVFRYTGAEIWADAEAVAKALIADGMKALAARAGGMV